jgi:hypothetical protein
MVCIELQHRRATTGLEFSYSNTASFIVLAASLSAHALQMLPPLAYLHMPASNLTTKFVIGNLNKVIRRECSA